VVAAVSADPAIVRSSTVVSLETLIPYRLSMLVELPVRPKHRGEHRPDRRPLTADPAGRDVGDDEQAALALGVADLRGAIDGLDPSSLGYPLRAFTTMEINQGGATEVLNHLREIPQVVEADWVAGEGDFLCQIVARDHAHLAKIIGAVWNSPAIVRSTTAMSLETLMPYRVTALSGAGPAAPVTASEARAARRITRDDLAVLRLLLTSPEVTAEQCRRQVHLSREQLQQALRRIGDAIRESTHQRDPAALGMAVRAFTILDVSQRGRTAAGDQFKMVPDHVADVRGVLEAHMITGDGDVLCQLAARDNDDLARIIRQVSFHPSVVGSATTISLEQVIPHRVIPLIMSNYLR
jgi:DNA-binding Lrp family transcriptional regulator